MTDYAPAISSIESGGRYDLTGPVTRTGDRAYGRYQIMGANVGPWTAAVLGRQMTPQEFVANPQAQDAVFNAKFGDLVNKYGPGGAARAWFAGEGGMNNPAAKDVLGTTVAGYEQKFLSALGQPVAAAPQVPPNAAQTPTNIGDLFTSFGGDQFAALTPPTHVAQVPPATDTTKGGFDPVFQPRAAVLPRMADRFARRG